MLDYVLHCIALVIAFLCCFVACDASAPSGVHAILRVDKSMNVLNVLEILNCNKIVKSRYNWLYIAALKFSGSIKRIKAGEFEITPMLTPADIFDKIINGKYFYRSILIPEGLTNFRVIDIINANHFIVGDYLHTPDYPLMPDRYIYQHGDTKQTLLQWMGKAMADFLDKEWETRSTIIRKLELSKIEVITLASIVEKEAYLDSERSMVASVFVNRLSMNMRLQSDPTVIYGITMGKSELGRELNRADIKNSDSPYNTYKIRGLPPTPICNPSKKSIKAALNPAESKYLFFLAMPNSHNLLFAETYQQHLANVKKMKSYTNSSDS